MHTNSLRLVFLALGSLCAMSATAADCAIERAVYRPAGGFGQTERGVYELVHTVKKIPANHSNLVVTIRQPASKKAHDFGFAFSNGYGRTHLLYSGPDVYEQAEGDSKEDAEGPGSTIMYFDAQMRAVEAPMKAGQKGPLFLVMPEIGVKFWYRGKDDRQFVPPDGIWRLASCR